MGEVSWASFACFYLSQAPAGCCLKFTVCQLLRATFLLRCFYFYTASYHLSSLYWTDTEKKSLEKVQQIIALLFPCEHYERRVKHLLPDDATQFCILFHLFCVIYTFSWTWMLEYMAESLHQGMAQWLLCKLGKQYL